jgi:hypothetical protein
MEINGKVWCFFEQSGTFKNEFKKLGYEAVDVDIQNNFGQTDHQIDLFTEIESAYDGKPSLFDNIRGGDLIMAFFPCIYFCEKSQVAFHYNYINYRNLSIREATDKILERETHRSIFYKLAIKMYAVAKERGLKLVMENPWSGIGYLRNNFVEEPSLIDKNRMLRGDYFVKPTAYWFVNCTPTRGCSMQNDKEKKTIAHSKSAPQGGLCSEERSMISPDYARNFICDFILGKQQQNTMLCLF